MLFNACKIGCWLAQNNRRSAPGYIMASESYLVSDCEQELILCFRHTIPVHLNMNRNCSQSDINDIDGGTGWQAGNLKF